MEQEVSDPKDEWERLHSRRRDDGGYEYVSPTEPHKRKSRMISRTFGRIWPWNRK